LYNLLVVDDERYIADNVAALVAHRLPDCSVKVAYLAKTALEMAAEGPVDVLVTDIEMPGMSGFLLSEQIVRMHPHCRVVILTAYNNSDYMLKAFRQDIVDYVLKLEDEDTLLRAIGKAIRALGQPPPLVPAASAEPAHEEGSESPLHEYDALLAKIFLFINENYESDISLVRIAEHVNFNPSYLSRLFKKAYGQTLSEYIWDFKFKKAQDMLREDSIRISAISDKLGFESKAYFTRFFKRMAGMTPKEYRARNRYGG